MWGVLRAPSSSWRHVEPGWLCPSYLMHKGRRLLSISMFNVHVSMMHLSSIYDAMIIMMTIIIIRVRCNAHHDDNPHHPCTMRWSSWWQSSSCMYNAMIIMMTILIIHVRCDDHHDDNPHRTCTMQWSSWWQSSSSVYDAMIIIHVRSVSYTHLTLPTIYSV